VNFKILFISQDDPFYVRLFFEEFFRRYKDVNEIKAVVIAQPMGKKSLVDLARQMYDFYGPLDFVRMGVKFATYKLAASAPFSSGLNGLRTLAQLCNRHTIPVIRESHVNAAPFLEKMRGMNPDLIISVASPAIFKKDLIRIPRFGCINIHNGKLPKYRGMLPNFWQMYHGEEAIGITIHEINPGIDDGRIILQRDIDILSGESLDALIKRTKRLGAHIMIEAIERIRTGKATYIENPASEGSYFSFPTRKDVKEFKRKGHRLL
jgi:methionyl-tRNA formyltransferase